VWPWTGAWGARVGGGRRGRRPPPPYRVVLWVACPREWWVPRSSKSRHRNRLVYTGFTTEMDWMPASSTLPLQIPYRDDYYIPISFLKKKSTVQWRTAPNWRYEV
jgi:hypothetical protein